MVSLGISSQSVIRTSGGSWMVIGGGCNCAWCPRGASRSHHCISTAGAGDTLQLQPAVYILTPEGTQGPRGFLMGLRVSSWPLRVPLSCGGLGGLRPLICGTSGNNVGFGGERLHGEELVGVEAMGFIPHPTWARTARVSDQASVQPGVETRLQRTRPTRLFAFPLEQLLNQNQERLRLSPGQGVQISPSGVFKTEF